MLYVYDLVYIPFIHQDYNSSENKMYLNRMD